MKDFRVGQEIGFEDEFVDEDSFDEDDLSEVDFSQITGKNFPKSFTNVKSKIKQVKSTKKVVPKKPLTQRIPVRDKAFIESPKIRKIGKVIVPRDRKVIVEHANSFILSDECFDAKRINFHEGKKLKEIILSFNNTGLVDFDLQMFNPSMSLDFLHSTSLNLNDQIKVADGTAVSYSDLLFNILANPLLVYNAKIIIAGPSASDQINQPLRFINKNSAGVEKVFPISVGLQIDNFQKIRDCINFFCIHKKLNRPYIADGMDVIEYKVLAGNTVTMAFFCKQPLLKERLFKKEIANNKKLI